MNRASVFNSRAVTLLIGLVLLAVGALAALWQADMILVGSDRLRVSWATTVADQPWYPWALGGGGAVLCLLGLRGLIGLLRQHKVTDLTIPSSDSSTSLSFDLGSVMSAASQELSDCLGVRSVQGRAGVEKSKTMCSFSITIDPNADLSALVKDCDRVINELLACVGRDDVLCRAVIENTSRKSSLSRVG